MIGLSTRLLNEIVHRAIRNIKRVGFRKIGYIWSQCKGVYANSNLIRRSSDLDVQLAGTWKAHP